MIELLFSSRILLCDGDWLVPGTIIAIGLYVDGAFSAKRQIAGFTRGKDAVA
jgi:hypothetical protein